MKLAKGNYLGQSGYFYTYSKSGFKNRMESEEKNSFIKALKHVYSFSSCQLFVALENRAQVNSRSPLKGPQTVWEETGIRTPAGGLTFYWPLYHRAFRLPCDPNVTYWSSYAFVTKSLWVMMNSITETDLGRFFLLSEQKEQCNENIGDIKGKPLGRLIRITHQFWKAKYLVFPKLPRWFFLQKEMAGIPFSSAPEIKLFVSK